MCGQLRSLWKVLALALPRMIYFSVLFVPIMLGFTLLAHTVWGPYMDDFQSVLQSAISLLLFMKGSIDLRQMYELEPWWTVLFAVSFFFIVTFFTMNMFTAIMVRVFSVRVCMCVCVCVCL